MRIVYCYGDKKVFFDSESSQVVIGRPKEGVRIDLDLTPDKTVSRPHARVYIRDGQYWIEDLKSTRGTQVSGNEIKGKGKRRLQAGDTIRVGETILHVEIPVEQVDVGRTLPPEPAAAEPPIEIGEVLDANAPAFVSADTTTSVTARRLAFLYELPLEWGAEIRLDALLQTILEQLIKVIPSASRGALLVEDRASGGLLLKAHVPAGNPTASLTLARRAMEQKEGFLWRRGEDVSASQLEYHTESGMYAPLVWKGQTLGAICVDNCEIGRPFESDDLRLLVAVAHQAAMAIEQNRLHEDLRRNATLLGRLLTNFSPKIRENLLQKARHGKLHLGGEKSEVTILCSDIRGFTRISENLDPEDVVEMLNDYFSALVESIFQHDGTIDKFVGDAILAVFGSPEPDAQQQEKAVRAALQMQAAMKELNATRAARGQVICDIGIGINCGEVLHGFIGSDERMEFTVIGNVVNRAARYCDGAHAGEVLISPEMYERVWKLAQAEPTTIATKHEGGFPAFRVKGLKS